MDDLEKIYRILSQLKAVFGIWAILILITIGMGLWLYWRFILGKFDAIARKSVERAITEIWIKTNKKYEKQIDAIHQPHQLKINLCHQQ